VRNVRPVAAVPANVVCLVKLDAQVLMAVMDPMVSQVTLAHLEIPSRCVPSTCANSLSSAHAFHPVVPMASPDVPATLACLETMVLLVAMEMLVPVDLRARKDLPETTVHLAILDKLVVPVNWLAKLLATLANPETPAVKADPELLDNPEDLATTAATVPLETRATPVNPANQANLAIPALLACLETLECAAVATNVLRLVLHQDIK